MKAFLSKIWTWIVSNKIIAIVAASVIVVGTTCAVVLPIALHEHSYADEWSCDAENHWHDATCKHEDEKSDSAAHTYANACDASCDVCGYTRTVGAHVYDNACDTKCNVCDAERTVGEHVYDNACDTACNICGATRAITHAHGTTLTAGDTTHYYLCSVCGDKKDETAHVFDKTVASSEYLKAEATATTKAQYYKSCVCGAKSATEYFETDKAPANLQVSDISKTYDGTPVSEPTITFDGVGGEGFEYWQGTTKLTGKPTNAGTYKVIVTIGETETHAGDRVEREFTIAKKTATFTAAPAMSSVTIKYGENYFVSYTTDGDGTATVEYKLRGADDAAYTATAPTNKGLYTARVSIAEGANYLALSATVDFEIEALMLGGLSTNVVYNGTDTHVIDMATYGYSGVTLRVTFSDGGAVGATPTGVSVLENDGPTANYTVNTSTCTVEIVAKTVSVSWTAPTDLVYSGTAKLPTATLGGIITGDDCTAELEVADGDNVNAGSFKYRVMTLMGVDADNYALPMNSASYTSPEYTITKKTLILPEISKDYDGNTAVSYTFTESDGLIAGDVCTLFFNVTVTDVGHYEDEEMTDISLTNANYKIGVSTCDLHILDTNALILQTTGRFHIDTDYIISVKVKQGTVKVGDSIVLPGTPDKVYEVLNIEKFHKFVEYATVGDEVGLYVDGMAELTEVPVPAFLYENGNIPEMASEFLAKLYLKTEEEGGRQNPVTSTYMPNIRGLGPIQQATITLISHYAKEDTLMWFPGEIVLAKITLTTPVPASLLHGLEFNMTEDSGTSSRGTVTGVVVDDIINSAQSGNTMLKTDTFNTEALTPVVVKITNTRTVALETLEVFVSNGSGGGSYLTDFTLELYDKDFVKILGTHNNTEGTFTKDDSSTWSLSAKDTCYVVIKTTNAASDVFVRLI